MKFYTEEKEKVLANLDSGVDGISNEEAAARLERNGKNKLNEGKKVGILRRFFEQLCDPMIIVLLVAAALSFVTALYENESLADVFIILFVVIWAVQKHHKVCILLNRARITKIG